jgi:hypothetical protein
MTSLRARNSIFCAAPDKDAWVPVIRHPCKEQAVHSIGLLLAALVGVGLLALVWLVGIYAVVFGILLLVLAFQWRKLVTI